MEIEEINEKINLLRTEIPNASQSRISEIINELHLLGKELIKISIEIR